MRPRGGGHQPTVSAWEVTAGNLTPSSWKKNKKSIKILIETHLSYNIVQT